MHTTQLHASDHVYCTYLDHVGGGSPEFLRHEEALDVEGELTLVGCPGR